MTRLLRLSVLLLALSSVHCGIFDGIRNCRRIMCYNKVGAATIGSWSRKVCGHSCGTVQRYTRAECTASKQTPSDESMCTASTFRYGSGSATARRVKKLNWDIFSRQPSSKNVSPNSRLPPPSRENLTAGTEVIPAFGWSLKPSKASVAWSMEISTMTFLTTSVRSSTVQGG